MNTGDMQGKDGGDDLIAMQFRQFAAALAQAAAAAVQSSAHDGMTAAQAISRQLAELIELQTVEARRRGGRSEVDAQAQSRFLKAALADEVMLHTDWAGKTHWRHVLLETTLFNTAYAGQRVFADIEQVLREREPSQRPVARLYLALLSLGFQGRFRDGTDLAQIAGYRRELFQFIYQRAPDLGGREAVLADQPYASTLAHGGGRRLPKLGRRGVMLALALLLLLGVSEVVWLWQSWPVRQAIERPIVQATERSFTSATALHEVRSC